MNCLFHLRISTVLKQTSVALEQITQNIKNNNENMNQMLKISG